MPRESSLPWSEAQGKSGSGQAIWVQSPVLTLWAVWPSLPLPQPVLWFL